MTFLRRASNAALDNPLRFLRELTEFVDIAEIGNTLRVKRSRDKMRTTRNAIRLCRL